MSWEDVDTRVEQIGERPEDAWTPVEEPGEQPRPEEPDRGGLGRAFLCAAAVLIVTSAAIMAVRLWPAEKKVTPPAVKRVPDPVYVRSFGSSGQEPLVEPVGVAVAGGKVYVADAGLRQVVVFTPGGTRVSTFGGDTLAKPAYIALNPLDGRLYVTDRTLRGIRVFDLSGRFLRTFQPDASMDSSLSVEWHPLAIAFADNGVMYVTDAAERQRLLKIGPLGTLVADAGTFVPAGFAGTSVSYANGIAAGDGRVIVADSNNDRLLLLDSDLHYEGATRFEGLPRGLCVVSWGSDPVFAVVDTSGGAVRLVDRDGRRLKSFDGGGTSGGKLSRPTAVAHDGTSMLYVTDSGNSRIQAWRVTGTPRAIERVERAPRDLRPRIATSIAVAGIAAALVAFFACMRTRAPV